jgi:signal transduction histidine kinase
VYILKIRDNGIGIEEKILSKIFDPFFTTKTTNEAAGVGLYLSREIIQNHQGDISVTSVKNEYTEFTITLPKHQTK